MAFKLWYMHTLCCVLSHAQVARVKAKQAACLFIYLLIYLFVCLFVYLCILYLFRRSYLLYSQLDIHTCTCFHQYLHKYHHFCTEFCDSKDQLKSVKWEQIDLLITPTQTCLRNVSILFILIGSDSRATAIYCINKYLSVGTIYDTYCQLYKSRDPGASSTKKLWNIIQSRMLFPPFSGET